MNENQSLDQSAEETRSTIAEHGRKMLEQGLTKGTGGNISARVGDDHIAISPSGMPYNSVETEDVPVMDFDGERVRGDRDPSSELSMHSQVYRRRDDVGAVLHNHSPYATTFATIDEPIPASHYLIAFAGNEVPVASYETYATEELGNAAVETLGDDHNACLLQNHGVLAVGDDVESAFETALMVEYCARIQYQSMAIGEPTIIPEEEVDHLQSKFEGYGQSN
ncbi:class II aldolase/adducin family protein [Halogeometricum luteum]|uniref:Class II aldolase/adducin family protein n=1 Tax=Halogeometricum luteum TaxID=2950537 RepID=A0ABU2G5R5_9EURY|nr:class II aldolase/adducin family protein [Halogeometricum sp. S3BR5-2]MDS0295554.1 class II aldolase/adducin family protein [Halogeometricum sp. S3BR5-2]